MRLRYYFKKWTSLHIYLLLLLYLRFLHPIYIDFLFVCIFLYIFSLSLSLSLSLSYIWFGMHYMYFEHELLLMFFHDLWQILGVLVLFFIHSFSKFLFLFCLSTFIFLRHLTLSCSSLSLFHILHWLHYAFTFIRWFSFIIWIQFMNFIKWYSALSIIFFNVCRSVCAL